LAEIAALAVPRIRSPDPLLSRSGDRRGSFSRVADASHWRGASQLGGGSAKDTSDNNRYFWRGLIV